MITLALINANLGLITASLMQDLMIMMMIIWMMLILLILMMRIMIQKLVDVDRVVTLIDRD